MPISLANIIDREQGATSQEHKTQNDTEFSKMDHKKRMENFEEHETWTRRRLAYRFTKQFSKSCN